MTFPGCWMNASSVGAGGAVTSRAQVDSNKEATGRTAALSSRASFARARVEGWAMARSQRDLEGRFCAPLSPRDLAPLAGCYVKGVTGRSQSWGHFRSIRPKIGRAHV